METQAPVPLPVQPSQQDSQTWGMVCHLAALAAFSGIPFGNIFGPLVVWLIKREEMPFVDEQGKEALNFQITATIAFIVCILLCFVLIGIPLLLLLTVADVALVIVAGVKANEGISYRYPCTIRFIK